MADNKNANFKKKPFRSKDKANNGKRFDKNQKPDNKQKTGKKPADKPAKKEEKKNDYKCKDCGGQLVRRWIFSSGSETEPYTKLVCENCGASTKPREVRYGENGYVWGCKTPKEDTEQRKAC